METKIEPITSFRGDNFFLSNFYPCAITLDDVHYPTSEHAFQASKTVSNLERKKILTCETPKAAKKMGKTLTLRKDWEEIKVSTMKILLRQKFRRGTKLAKKLIATSPAELIEGNEWGDTFWGICNGKGQNQLGKLLMKRREFLIRMESEDGNNLSLSNSSLVFPPASKPKREESKPRVVHSSMQSMSSPNQDAEFPSYPRHIGVITFLERLSKNRNGQESILVQQEWPTLTSVVRGEETDRESVEQVTREKIKELITRLHGLSSECERHASRLESVVSSKKDLISWGDIDAAGVESSAGSGARPGRPPGRRPGSPYEIGEVGDRPRSHEPQAGRRGRPPGSKKGARTSDDGSGNVTPKRRQIDADRLKKLLGRDEDD